MKFSFKTSLILSAIILLLYQLRTVLLYNLALSPRSKTESIQSIVGMQREIEIKLAFFLQISPSTVEFLPRLLKSLWEDVNVYAIHIDTKVTEKHFASIKDNIYRQNPLYKSNVYFMRRESISYRGVSMTLNTVNGMKFLYDLDQHWDFFINLSGSDYPLLKPKIQRILLSFAYRSANFFCYFRKEEWNSESNHRLERNVFIDYSLTFSNNASTIKRLKTATKIQRSFPFPITKAEAWMINSRSFVEYVISSSDARKLLLSFATSSSSPEHYFSTLAYNSDFNSTIVPSCLRKVFWSWEGHKVSGGHPLNVDDIVDSPKKLNEIVRKSRAFYIRKFKRPDSPLLDQVDGYRESEANAEILRSHLSSILDKAKKRSKNASGSKSFN